MKSRDNRNVRSFVAYYHESRTHLSLAKASPEPRPVNLSKQGAVIAIPQVGGLHHRYEVRDAAPGPRGAFGGRNAALVMSVANATEDCSSHWNSHIPDNCDSRTRLIT